MDKLTSFPEFMRNKKNRIKEETESDGIEGYVYDGADGSQAVHWTCLVSGTSEEHAHDFDEYFTVVQGEYTLIIDGKKIPITPGKEYHIPKGVPHAGEFKTGTRTIHFFGGKRTERKA